MKKIQFSTWALDIQRLTLKYCPLADMWTMIDVFKIPYEDRPFLEDLATTHWPMCWSFDHRETGYSIPFLYGKEDLDDLIKRFRFRTDLYLTFGTEFSSESVNAVVDCYLNYQACHGGRRQSLFLIETMRVTVEIFDQIGEPEISFSHSRKTLQNLDSFAAKVVEHMDCAKDAPSIALCCKTLGVLNSDTDFHKRISVSTINKLLHVLTKYQNESFIVSNALWALYMLSISPAISVYQNIPGHFHGFSNLQHILSIGGDNGFMALIWNLFDIYADDPDVSAKCFRFVANIACLDNQLSVQLKHDAASKAIEAMKRFPDEICVQSKCLALIVNLHEMIDPYLDRLLDLGMRAVENLPPDTYLYGKFVYVVENSIYSNSLHSVIERWGDIEPCLQKARKFKVLHSTIDRCTRRVRDFLPEDREV